MSFSVQRSVVESFKFNDKSIRAFYIKDVGQCLISQDVYTVMGYDKENGVESMQQLVREKYKMRLGDTMIGMKEEDKNVHLHLDTVLLKEPGLYCFCLRCIKDEAEPFMEWVVETALPREVRKLASIIEEKDAVIALMKVYKVMTTKYRPSNMRTWNCRHKETCIRPSYKDVNIPSPILGHVM